MEVCKHHVPITETYGSCGLNLYGGKPSLGTCAACTFVNEGWKKEFEKTRLNRPRRKPRQRYVAPSIPEMIANFAKHSAEIIKSGVRVVPEEVFHERLAGCRSCPEDLWDEEARGGAGKCKHPTCGCTRAKMLFASMRCPLDPPQWTKFKREES